MPPASPEAFVRAFELDTEKDTLEPDLPSAYSPDTATLQWNQQPVQALTPAIESAFVGASSHMYPPTPAGVRGDTESVASFATGSSTSKKAERESMLLAPPGGPLVLGIALVDFNHIVGPKIEFYEGEIFEDEEIAKILPFLALPDGAHLSSEDYTYFHIVPTSPNPTTVFGISCNRQIATSALLVKDVDVTRSTVQKAVVVLVSRPLFGPIRDRLGVVTLALFEQRDFSNLQILTDFYKSLELSLKSHLTTSGLYMGTSLRDLVHVFRQRTLILLKALMLQKRIMFYGHPLERLCTYQYSLVTLMPGLLQNLEDCGSPPLAARASTLMRPSSLKTSDHKSMMAYLGLPLDLFGKDAFFQPYLPLQQLDMIKESKSWLCGTTNSIVGQQKEIDLFVDTETGIVEFRDYQLEKSAGLTAADRKWMDDIIKDVNEGWDEDGQRTQFRGSDDYLRQKFEEYISGALASIKYADFIAKGKGNDVVITEGGENNNAMQDYNPLWISELRRTNAYEVWERMTDPLLFDITEPRHPCTGMTSVVGDIGLRLQEGVQDLKIGQQLAPTREVISKTFATGSTNFLKAVEGVKERWMIRTPSIPATPPDSGRGTPVDLGKDPDAVSVKSTTSTRNSPAIQQTRSPTQQTSSPPIGGSEFAQRATSTLSGWGSGIGSFISNRASKFSLGGGIITAPASTPTIATSTVAPKQDEPDDIPEQFVPRDLDAEREKAERKKVGESAAGQQKT
ncbi:hypothetical protein BDM02DRAFT_3122485 [Thelephora ganbajun]|uniref:Uncharacterized protein n=1 Tax=Thelephora ganbajun TaxID=370292 RepID=A0ACB6Z3D1_THEGA|nr:hypothetical protein BDM02DRAFT_3122485 [Thelephora ganbajun]